MNPKIEQLLDYLLHKLKPNGCPIPHNAWQRGLSKVMCGLTRAPHQSPWMEWQWGNWVGAFAGYDELGRQLGEANVLPAWRGTPLADKWHPFKGPGSRQGYPFNMDAMHEVLHCWEALLEDSLTLRALYCQHFNIDHTQPLAAKDVYIISLVAVSISGFLLRKGDNPVPDGQLPRLTAAAFKVLGGLYAASNRLLSQAHTMLMQDKLDTEIFLNYLETEHLLLSPEMRACAGPVKMIQQILHTVINPCQEPDNYQGLSYLANDKHRAFAYGCVCVRIDLMVLLHWRGLKQLLQQLLQQDIPASMRALIMEETELGLQDDTPLTAYIDVVQRILSVFNTVESTEAEQAFITTLLKQQSQSAETNFETISANCYQLEIAMRRFTCQQQKTLDQILQIQSPPLSEQTWSPAPGSHFLKTLFSLNAQGKTNKQKPAVQTV